MTKIKDCIKEFTLAWMLISFIESPSFAQLKADFSIDKNGGCSPFTVSFTNTTTGASSNAVYSWDLGNGNTSALINAGATYVVEKTYTIILTVTDGNKSSSQTKQITVYKRPTVDFSFDVAKGCLPLPVNFTASATPGDGNISNYYWDFGDGSTQQSYSQQFQHTYNFADTSTVGLTVTNSYGCYTSIQKPATIILSAMQASFGADNLVLCNISDPIQFSNTSSGPGSLSYAWDFGDGTNSTGTSPSHVYNKKGTYSVTLTVSNKDGCKVTSTQTNYINVKNFSTDFSVPQLICKNSYPTFTDNSTPGATSKLWLVDGLGACNWCTYGTFNYSFYDTLAHTIQLINTYGNCKDSLTKKISIKDIPDIKPFVVNIPEYCDVPVTVNFKDTTKSVVKWLWYFDNGLYNPPSSTLQAPSYPYNSSQFYGVQLTVTNAAGCTATENQTVDIIYNYASVYMVNGLPNVGCDSVPTEFAAGVNRDSIVSYQWNFGDGTLSTLAQPKHTYTNPGTYRVTLSFKTNKGCTGNAAYYNTITLYKRPVADFAIKGNTTICGNTRTTFVDRSNGPVTSWDWDFGGANSGYSTNGSNPTIQYSDSGVFNVKMIAYNGIYACADTITKENYVHVLPPFPQISSVINTCDGTRGLVKFTESSKYAQSWQWNFGDGSSSLNYTTKQDTMSHTYSATRTYEVYLTVTNGQCSVKDSATAYVLLKQNPVLSSQISAACSNTAVNMEITGMESNPSVYYSGYNFYSVVGAQYGDSSNYSGSIAALNYYTFVNSSGIVVPALDPLKTNFRVITQSYYFGCNDTSNFIPIKINGPKAAFKIVEGNPCFKYPVILQDASIAGSNSKIAKWDWNFYDASGITNQYSSGSIAHVYSSPGQYYVDLKVTDADGCSDVATGYLNPSGPESAFTYYPANVTPNSPVTFNNNTNVFNSYNTQYLWIFGDGSTSTDFSPTHTYTNVAVDTVKLIAINPDTHCQDTSIQIINVKIINTQFSFNKTYVSASSCPPVIVHFTNTSSNALSIAWDFGDGSKADNQNNPSHTYYNAGTYKVTMYGYGYNGTTDTTVDSIIVKAPFAKLNADAYFGCLSKTITLNAQIIDANSFVWDFGDGTINQTKDSFSTHSYLSPGIYSPALIMTDSNGCSLLSYLPQKVVIDSLGIKINKTPAKLCGPGIVTFSDPVVTSFAEQNQQALQYHWDFG
ncbi:MAG TPA: PKD domain-containing protein, partial [Puia sp.]|nr:PKD domain-containing protein [Puia sp.]